MESKSEPEQMHVQKELAQGGQPCLLGDTGILGSWFGEVGGGEKLGGLCWPWLGTICCTCGWQSPLCSPHEAGNSLVVHHLLPRGWCRGLAGPTGWAAWVLSQAGAPNPWWSPLSIFSMVGDQEQPMDLRNPVFPHPLAQGAVAGLGEGEAGD